MARSIKIDNHPFRFLLYLEWILLGISIITSVLPYPSPRFSSRFPELTILSLTIFGLMGLRLPTNSKITKIVYTGCEIIFIFIIGLFEGRGTRMFPFLHIILVTRSCLIFKLPGRLTVTLISFSLFLFTLISRFPRPPLPIHAQERFRFFTLSLTLVFGLSLIFVLLLMNSLLSERQSREELAIANEKLRQYALRIENQATLEERNRIAREIHDSLGHSLTALNLQLETALKLSQSNPNKAQSFLARAKELGSKSLQDVRNSVSTLRSHPLQGKTLEEAIDAIAEDFQRNTGIVFTSSLNIEHRLSTEVSTAIYRIIQESLTNISKHARATEVNLEIYLNRGSLYLIIKDNGRGFDIQKNTTGFGLQSMRDRTLALGGKFTINSSIDGGCQITVDIPSGRLT